MNDRAPDSGGVRRWRLVRAGRDAVPSSVRRFSARARRRRLRAARGWLIGAAALALLAASGLVVYDTSLLSVSEIRVEGAVSVSAEQVRAAAAVPLGTPLARVDTGAVDRRVLAQLAPVAQARTSRSWPNTLVVRIIERTAVGAVPQDDGYLLVDASGVVFGTRPTPPAGLALLRLAAPGPDDPTTRAVLTVLAALTPQLREQLVALVAEAPTRIRLELLGGREIRWGDATQNEAKARVATRLLARPGTVFDVSAPDVVTVR